MQIGYGLVKIITWNLCECISSEARYIIPYVPYDDRQLTMILPALHAG
jgi:hypothetical protein